MCVCVCCVVEAKREHANDEIQIIKSHAHRTAFTANPNFESDVSNVITLCGCRDGNFRQ